MDPSAGTFSEFKVRSMNNSQNRALHQHVFDMNLLREIFGYFNLEILETAIIETDYIVLGKKELHPEFSLSHIARVSINRDILNLLILS